MSSRWISRLRPYSVAKYFSDAFSGAGELARQAASGGRERCERSPCDRCGGEADRRFRGGYRERFRCHDRRSAVNDTRGRRERDDGGKQHGRRPATSGLLRTDKRLEQLCCLRARPWPRAPGTARGRTIARVQDPAVRERREALVLEACAKVRRVPREKVRHRLAHPGGVRRAPPGR